MMLLIDERTPDVVNAPLIESVQRKRVAVGDPVRLGFLAELSRSILSSKQCKSYPDLVTLGYFCRKRALAARVSELEPSGGRVGWGTLIHIAPANVPMNFAYSFLFGFLSGNSNIVRLPSRSWPQVDLFLEFFSNLCSRKEYADIGRTTHFVRTNRDSNWLQEGVERCDGLLVWGGDETVSIFRGLKKRPRCVEMYFPNRISSLVISADFFLELDSAKQSRVVRGFYNDTYIVDHNACSSPSKIIWIGSEEVVKESQLAFWSQVVELLNAEEYSLDPIARVDRYLDVLRDADSLAGAPKNREWASDLWTFECDFPANQGRYGRFCQIEKCHLREGLSCLSADEQTLTYIGFEPSVIEKHLEDAEICTDRIVPVGKALEMDFIWDGVDLLGRFSRRVDII